MVRIEPASDVDLVRVLWKEYWSEMGLPLEFQEFAEELRNLPGAYALWIAWMNNEAVGTIAMRPIDGESCEAKRLFVRPKYRSHGIGQALIAHLFQAAREQGYKRVYADTLPSMAAAIPMYQRLGFRETRPYSTRPTEGAIYFCHELI